MKPAKPELLAPAGGMEALMAAVENGADAVYLGARAFSARGYASNFSEEELEKAIDYAHLRGVKIYVTVNTLLKEGELESALILLSRLREMGTDAIIIQDIGLISLSRKYLPDLPLHASTQMTLHNSEGVRFVKELGIERVVLSREASLEDIKEIKEKNNVEIEAFVHGALCISYSGQCLLSSLIGGRSGNRGYCAQPCRKKYRLYCEGMQIKTSGSYLLSPKDLNTTSGLGALIESGIESFKIEGRMKRPEYVAGVVRIYRRLIDRYLKNPAGYSVSEQEQETLTQLFNRGFTSGYFFGNPRGKIMSWENPHNRGIPAGTVISYDRRTERIRVKLSNTLRLGDGIMVENAETRSEDKGKIISSMYAEKGPVYSAGKGEVIEIPFDSRAPSGSMVYRTHDKKLMDSLKKESESGSLRPKIPLFLTATLAPGKPARLEIKDSDSNTVTVESEYLVEKAEKLPTSKAQIEKQLTKLGNTIFEAAGLNVGVEKDIFIPVGQLNDLRTKAVLKLENLRVSKWKRKSLENLQLPAPGERKTKVVEGIKEAEEIREAVETEETTKTEGIEETEEIKKLKAQKFPGKPLLSVSVYSLEGLERALAGGADCVYFGEGLFRKPKAAGKEKNSEGEEVSFRDLDSIFESAVLKARAAGRKIYFNTPKIVRDSEMKQVEETLSSVAKLGADGVLVSNLGTFNLAKEKKIPFIADSPLNIYNGYTFTLILQKGAEMAVISPELTLEELKEIASHGPAECIVHGRLELMESEHCLAGGLLGKEGSQCSAPCTSGNFTLVDEKNYEFPLIMDYQCRTHLLNSRSLCMLEHVPAFIESGISSLRIETLGMNSVEEIRRITGKYRKAIDAFYETGEKRKEKCEGLGKGFTTGHYFRGVQ
jgi:putative protease